MEGIRNAPSPTETTAQEACKSEKEFHQREAFSAAQRGVGGALGSRPGPWGVFLALAPLVGEFIPETFQNDS